MALALAAILAACGGGQGDKMGDAGGAGADLSIGADLSAAAPDGGDGRAISDGVGAKSGGGTGACTPTEDRYIDGDYGTVVARDGRSFPVPGPLREGGAACTDLHNPCAGGQNAAWQAQLRTVVVDEAPGAVEVTGYLYADNYFELYVNGRYVCRDALDFVPFNAHVVRFKAAYPMTIALLGIDWEQSLGVGVEQRNGQNNVGDGGLVARFVDDRGRVVASSGQWRCLPHYIAPLDDPQCVKAGRDSSGCPAMAACVSGDLSGCRALHWEVPTDWFLPAFDDGAWPGASVYTLDQLGPKTAFTANAALFAGASVIWSKNLLTDNLVLCRTTAAP